MDYPIFISREDVMQCKRTKSYKILYNIRYVFKYPIHQKRIKFKDFCDYECFDKDDVLRLINSP